MPDQTARLIAIHLALFLALTEPQATTAQPAAPTLPIEGSLQHRPLTGADAIRVTPAVDRAYDGVFVIECSDIDRPGLVDLEKQFVVNIDHHSTTELFGTVNWIDSTASAVGEMIYNLCKATGVRVTKEIAECVYTALLTDTGSFHYSNTTVLFPYSSTRFSTCQRTARERTTFSRSRPF